MGDYHQLPTLRKDAEENQWFHNWINAFGPVAVDSYPAIRVGSNKIDVWDIPHEWDIVTKGWTEYESLVWGNITSYAPYIEKKSPWDFNLN
jgi:hypothetical protein